MLFYVKKIDYSKMEIICPIDDILNFLSHINITNNKLIDYINEKLNENKKIIVPFLSTENYNGLTESDIVVSDSTDLEKDKNDKLKIVLNVIQKIYGSLNFVNVLNFIIINNKLLNENIFLTKDSLNEKLNNIDFITDEEKDFIKKNFNKLEDYINLIDAYQDFIENLEISDNVDGNTSLLNTFFDKIKNIYKEEGN